MLALCNQVTFNIRFSVPKNSVTTRNPRLFWVSVLQALVVDFKDVNKEQERDQGHLCSHWSLDEWLTAVMCSAVAAARRFEKRLVDRSQKSGLMLYRGGSRRLRLDPQFLSTNVRSYLNFWQLRIVLLEKTLITKFTENHLLMLLSDLNYDCAIYKRRIAVAWNSRPRQKKFFLTHRCYV